MNRLKYTVQFAHAYLTDMFLLLFIVLILNVHNGKEPMILPFFIIIVLTMILSFVIVRRFKPGRIYFILPAVLAICLALDFNWLSALLIAYLPVWRLEYLHDDVNNTFPEITLIVTFLLLISTSILTTESTVSYSLHFHLVFLCLLIFFFIGRIIIHLTGNGYSKLQNLYIFIVLSGVFILLGVSFGLVYNYVVFGIKYIVVLLLNGFIFLLRPIFSIFENIEFELPKMEMEEKVNTEEEEELQQNFNQDSTLSQIPVDTVLGILFAAAVIIGLYIYYKMRNQPSIENMEEEMNASASIFQAKHEVKNRKARAPEDRVRKVYFEFEKWLASKNMGRYRNETITEWIRRLDLDKIIDQKRLQIYMKARYRDTNTTDDEYRKYKGNIQLMKKDITQHLKNIKKGQGF